LRGTVSAGNGIASPSGGSGGTYLQRRMLSGMKAPMIAAARMVRIIRSGTSMLSATILCALALAGCGGGTVTLSNNHQTPTPDPCNVPAFDSTLPFPLRVKHAFIVMLENHRFETVFGSPSMPYLNQLARTYAYAAGYFASAHPSLPNYFFLTAGVPITESDTGPESVSDDNVVRRLIMAGKTWKEYSEGLPSAGYDGGNVGTYVQHHNPLSYFSDVRDDPSQKANLVPFSQLSADLANHRLPDYAFIVPDNVHNAHSCPSSQPDCTDDQRLATADDWLKQNIAPLIDAPDLSQAGGGVVIVVFDEAAGTDTQMGGGHVLWVVVGPNVNRGFVATTCYQHPSTLRFMTSLLGLPNAPGAAATAPDMREFLQGN
jgi:phosphatidylinositol-3-phosphatase